ncbi:type II toxin-antitoxin system Phd/YefM family antitoxin [Elusimicrobiota bacterium]
MTRTLNLKELRPKLPQVMEAIDKKLDRYVVTKRGHPLAVILSIEDYEGMLETMEIMRDKAALKRIRKAQEHVRRGKTRSLEEIHRKLGIL